MARDPAHSTGGRRSVSSKPRRPDVSYWLQRRTELEGEPFASDCRLSSCFRRCTDRGLGQCLRVDREVLCPREHPGKYEGRLIQARGQTDRIPRRQRRDVDGKAWIDQRSPRLHEAVLLGVHLLFLLCCLQGTLGAGIAFGGPCDTSGSNSIVTGSPSCGVKVSLYYPNKPVNESRLFAASSGNLRLGFAVSEILPNNAKVTMLLPAQREGFKLDYGGTTEVVPIVTAGGTEQLLAAHGTGTPSFSVESQATGQLVTILFGRMGSPTLADGEAGFEFDLTYVRNPYANAGLPAANVEVKLFYANGSVWYTGNAPLPEIGPYNMTASDATFELVNPAAGSQTDIIVTLSTRGWIPPDGRIEIILPTGFILTFGSTVATFQQNFGEGHAIYVQDVSPHQNKITLLMAGALGFQVSPLDPLFSASFRLTKIRNPFSGLTGSFQITTLSGNNDIIDRGILPGINVGRGSLRNVVVSVSDDAARQIADYTFTMSSTGTVPGDGKFRIVFPFGYYLHEPTLVAYNGLGKTGVPTLSYSGRTIIIQLGAQANSSESIDATDGISFSIAGIVNPGAGAISSYVLQSTFNDMSQVIDEAIVPTIGIVTGMFPSRSITIAENRAGQTNAITVSISTAGFISDDAKIRVTLPSGLAPSLPTTSNVSVSECCENGNCYSPCNITVSSISGNMVTVQLPGVGNRNLALGSSIGFTISNVRNLWAGPKDGFDLTLLLSDGISSVMQAMDVDGPVIIASNFLGVSAIFSETPTLPASFGTPIAGRCGAYRIKINLNGILPEFATFKFTFPESIQLNDAFCDFTDYTYTAPVSRLTHFRIPLQYLLRSDARERVLISQVVASGRSDSWNTPHYVELYITNLRHLRAGPLDPIKIEALFPDTISTVQQNLSVPLLPVIAMGSDLPTGLKISATPQSFNAGVRTTVIVNVETMGRLPRTGIVEVIFPPSFRVNDGDNTRVLSSTLNATESNMEVVYSDATRGIIQVQIDTKLPTAEKPDGIINSTFICESATPDYRTCTRNPKAITPGALLMGYGDDKTLPGYVRGKLSFALSQIRNLAGGFSGNFEVNTYLNDGTSLNERNAAVPGVTLVVGSLAEATVQPAVFRSAARTTVDVVVTISNTLQASGNVVIVFPPGFDVNDGSPSNVTHASLIRFMQEYSTPAKVVASDKTARSVTVGLGGREDDFLSAFNIVKFTVTNVRLMVARPAPGENSELSGNFEVSTQLASGAFVETISVNGVRVSPNTIEPFPVGDGQVLLESLIRGTGLSVTVQYSSGSVLPEDGVIVIGFPSTYFFNVGGKSNATVTYNGIEDTTYKVLNITDADRAHVRLKRNGTFAVTPGQIIQVKISNVKVSDDVIPTGEHNISVQTIGGATIARGILHDVHIGRPSEPLDLFLDNCKANWPEPDPRCVQVSWKAPTDDAGSPIVKYKISFAASSIRFNDVVQDIEVDADEGGAKLAGGLPLKFASDRLAEGFIYYVRIRAGTLNGGVLGYGKPGYGNAVRAVSLPGPPRASLLRSDTTNRLYAAWFQPQFTGALNPPTEIVGYKVEFSRFDSSFNNVGTNEIKNTHGNARSLTSNLLQPGRYYARVSAANLAGFGEPSVYKMTALATPIVSVAWDDTVTPAEGSVQNIQVGYLLRLDIRAFDGDITDEVDVLIDSDQGIPVRASLHPLVTSGKDGGTANVGTRVFEMTPLPQQAGLRFQLCFRSRNSNLPIFILGPNIDIVRCIKVQVVLPELSWTGPSDQIEGLTPEPGTSYTTFPGCVVRIPLYANSVWYAIKFGYDVYVMEFNGTFTRSGDNIAGAEVLEPHPQSVISPSSYVNIPNNYSWSGRLDYQPPVSLAGRKLKVCFTASDEWGLDKIERCVFISTGSCKACLKEGQTLSGLAAEYSTDWLQIWATNPRMGNPDASNAAGTLVNLGLHYEARGGETVSDLALQFFTTVDRVLESNPDFVDRSGGIEKALSRALVPNYKMCIIPPLCQIECPGGGRCHVRSPSENKGFIV